MQTQGPWGPVTTRHYPGESWDIIPGLLDEGHINKILITTVRYLLHVDYRLQRYHLRSLRTPIHIRWSYDRLASIMGIPKKWIWHVMFSLQWRHNGRDSVSNHQPHDCLLNCLFRRRWKKTSKLRVTVLCVGNSPGTGEFPAQMASNAENGSIWWRHRVHVKTTHRPSWH